jgi:uncharacterized damage-inducible protein DinB
VSRDRVDLLLVLKDHSYEQEGWFVPLLQAVEGVTATQAAWQPAGGGNSIWQTLYHLNFYNELYLRRLTGQEVGRGVASNDETFVVPAGPDAEAAWQAEVERARRIGAEFRTALAELDDAGLDGLGKVGGALPHLVMHDAYHAGQIVLIRKQQGSWPASRG